MSKKTQAAADVVRFVLSVTVTMEIETGTALKCTKFPTTGYARVLKFMFIWHELGGIGTGC